jgi:Leucine-rich repeat (LRR) protein
VDALRLLNFSFVMCLQGLFLFAGCGPAAPSTATPGASVKANSEVASAPAAEDAAALKALEDVESKVQRDAEGFIVDIDLRGTTATDATLIPLSALKRLRSLHLDELPITDVGVATIATYQGPLANLDLRGCTLTDAAMTSIAQLKSLRALRLSGDNNQTTIADEGVSSLQNLTSLRVLAVDGLWVSTAGLQKLPSGIEELYLKSSLADDESMAVVAKFANLRKLRISKTQVSNTGLGHLTACTRLEDLDLSEDSLIDNDGLVAVGKITSLKKLNLWRVAVNDAGISHLAPLKNLEWLNLDNTQLTDGGLSVLKEMNALTFLHLGSTAVSDSGIPSLLHLKNLKDLKVTRTSVTENGVAELKKHLPQTEVQLKYKENL